MEKHLPVTFPGGRKVEVEVNGHSIVTDQPVKEGGEGKVPTPFDLFLASLATCAGHYARSFCTTRNLSTEGLALDVRCYFDEKQKRYTALAFDVTLPEDFPEKYRSAILRAVEACFVKKHVENPPLFSTRIVE